MFDIGFLELVMIGTVALLVIGPERLPGAVRTGAAYLRRFRRTFNDLRREVEQELHNDEVMRELKQTGEQLSGEVKQVREQLGQTSKNVSDSLDSAAKPAPSGSGKPGNE
ncbi:MAG: Sec-independent protein translocase protein TatB [Parahaliea sp.]